MDTCALNGGFEICSERGGFKYLPDYYSMKIVPIRFSHIMYYYSKAKNNDKQVDDNKYP